MMLLRFSFLPFARDMGADAGVGTGAGLMASVPFNERRTQRFVIDEEEEVGADANIYSTNLGTWKDGKGQTVLQRSPSKVTSLQITSDAAMSLLQYFRLGLDPQKWYAVGEIAEMVLMIYAAKGPMGELRPDELCTKAIQSNKRSVEQSLHAR